MTRAYSTHDLTATMTHMSTRRTGTITPPACLCLCSAILQSSPPLARCSCLYTLALRKC